MAVLGTSSFNEKVAAIDYEIRGQEPAIIDSKERIELAKDLNDPEWVAECEEVEQSLQKVEKGLVALGALRHEIAAHWKMEEKCVIGELVWAPPILPTETNQYTLDLAVIKIDAGSSTSTTTAATAST